MGSADPIFSPRNRREGRRLFHFLSNPRPNPPERKHHDQLAKANSHQSRRRRLHPHQRGQRQPSQHEHHQIAATGWLHLRQTWIPQHDGSLASNRTHQLKMGSLDPISPERKHHATPAQHLPHQAHTSQPRQTSGVSQQAHDGGVLGITRRHSISQSPRVHHLKGQP